MNHAPELAQEILEHLPVPLFLVVGSGVEALNACARQVERAAGGVPAVLLEGAWEIETSFGRVRVPGLDPEERRRVEQFESFGRYTGGIVHNLNNPLNALSGMIQLMMFRNTDMPELERLDHQTDELTKLIRYLGDRYRRLQEYERGAPLSWELVIAEELRFFRAESALKHRCQLEVDVPADSPCALAFREASWLFDRLLEAVLLLVPGEGMCPLFVEMSGGWPRLRLLEPDLSNSTEAAARLCQPLLLDLLRGPGLAVQWRADPAEVVVELVPSPQA